MVNIAVIGCGKIGERHLHAYRHLEGVTIAVSDVDNGRAADMGDRFGVPHLPVDNVLDGDFEAIDVCVPTPHHFATVMKALQAEKHVFCEKPLCLTREEGLQIRDEARRRNRSVMVGYLYRHHPALQFAKQTLDDGIIGTPYFASLRLGGRGSHAAWKHDASQGGGAASEMLVHMIDVAFWLLGDFTETEVHAVRTMRKQRTIGTEVVDATAEDLVLISLVRDGARALCEADLLTPSYMNHIEIQADGGSLFTSILHYLPTIVYCTRSRDIFNQGNNFFSFPQANLFELELGSFIQNLRQNRILHDSVDEALRIQRVLDQITGFGESYDRKSA